MVNIQKHHLLPTEYNYVSYEFNNTFVFPYTILTGWYVMEAKICLLCGRN